MTTQATIGTNLDGTLLITDATEGFTVRDAQSFNTIIKETATGLELTVYDGVNAPTVYLIEGGKLKNLLEMKASVNGSFDQTITDELAAANIQPKVGEFIDSGGSSYMAISAEADLVNNEYEVDFNDIGMLTFEGQIATVVNSALTAEFVKLGRHDWTEKERIEYLDGSTKVMEIAWAKMDTENKKYIVNCNDITP